MATKASAVFEVKSWSEVPYDEDGPRLNRASVYKSFQGDVQGDSRLEYLLLYRSEGSASFVGFERVSGRLGDRRGSFVLQHIGTFEKGFAQAVVSVVPGSATDQLKGLRGEGSFGASHGQHYTMTLEYDFDVTPPRSGSRK